MQRIRLGLVAMGLVCALLAKESSAQLTAFPGAEGAGAFAEGGRNGNSIYVVTNLNNSGVGSLRHAVDTAPSSGRMIVFGVSGTIDLQTDIVIDSPNLTIAGQTALGGGITLAHRALVVDDTHDIIIQHLAVRPGDFYTEPNVYEPDSIWVAGSNDVILDHVSASWSTDEVLSVTHGSTNVTVQWSLITEALHNSNHSKGNHGYGGIIHGGETTLHHNLYANNRSRNPATGNWDKSAPITPAHLDIVNNVISNPGDRYSYSGGDDQYEVNWVGNYGIEGPNTTRENELFHPDNANTFVYYAGNYYDTSEDGILQVTPASPNTLTGTSTTVNTFVETTNQPLITSAPDAYTQVLSHAGAAANRDPIDKRVINNVINQSGDHLDSQDEVGGWYYPTSTTQQLGQDGLPEWWKTAHGFAANDDTVGLQFASDGYTYLEKYLHYLNAPHLPAQNTAQIGISTAVGSGADAQINEISGVASGNGSGAQINARWTGPAGNTNEMILLRFDLSEVKLGSVTDATLDLTAFRDMANQQVRVYGLEHEVSNQLWDENSVSFDNAPGVDFDGDSGTRGVDLDELLLLGEFSTAGALEGDTVSFSNPDLSVFLNLLSYREDGSETVTLLLERQEVSSGQTRFASKEATALESGGTPVAAGTYAPLLQLDALLRDDADFNRDFLVNQDDRVFWERGFGILQGAYSLQGDADDDGDVDGKDFLMWQQQAVAVASPLTSPSQTVPEPTAGWLVAAAWATAASCRRRRLPK